MAFGALVLNSRLEIPGWIDVANPLVQRGLAEMIDDSKALPITRL
jgi:hypothetical protein